VKRAGITTRRQLLLAAAMLPLAGRPVHAAELPPAHNLKEELAAALARREPLVVMVSLEGCPFCKVARDHYLEPMHRQEGLHVAQVDMRSRNRVLDFHGKAVTHDDLVRQWKIRIAPTVLFFGRGGAEVAERLVGGYIPDFYGAYLDQRLVQARASLR
jgi:thioredoxin-related protein